MFVLRKPSAARTAKVFVSARESDFNFDARGATVESPPDGYFRNETVVVLGTGEAVWQAAGACLRSWRATKLGWCEFYCLQEEPEYGEVVVAQVKHLGFWSLQPSRIVKVEELERRCAVSIRTLQRHDEAGEERFELEWLPSGEVRFAIRSYSRPANLAGWLALPYVRRLQRRFGRQSTRLMQILVQRQ